jgi:ribonuclease R
LTSKRSGVSFRLADVIEVRLVEVAPIAGALRFEVASPAQERGEVKRPRNPTAILKVGNF